MNNPRSKETVDFLLESIACRIMRLIEGAGGFADFWSGSPLGELAAKQTEGGGIRREYH